MADGRIAPGRATLTAPEPAETPLRDKPLRLAIALALVAVAAGLTLLDAVVETGDALVPDIALDFADRLITLGAAVAGAFAVLRLSQLRDRTDGLEDAVRRAADEGRAWRAQSRRFVDGMARAIDAQFAEWQLTPAEADVAGLMLKGAAQREIAQLRRTSEATIRQQAQNVYRKSGLGSRAELSAYFLEDLFTLSEADAAAGPDPAEPAVAPQGWRQ
jgi:DNA-binding NarL/FixJ family response regulator